MDCLTEVAKGAVSKFGELGVEAMMKQFKYLIQHKKIIANLKEELDKLKALKEALQEWVEMESRKGYEIPRSVQKWISDVENLENKIQSFNENEFKKDKKCFGGQCPNYLALNYSLGKRATKRIEDIKGLKDEESRLRLIPYSKAPPALRSTFMEDIKSLESRNKIITEVIEKLKDDQFKWIGICGMGGVGKTTLVKELIKTIENKIFDIVVMAVVSQNPDYEKIQRQIADGLGLELKRLSIEGRGWEILERWKEIDAKKRKVLIVLDDVWKQLNFERIGVASRDKHNCIKIIFTSRDEKVCQMMGSQKNFRVSVMPDNEAWELFREMAGDVVDKPDINPIAKEIAKECGGLPLAIVTVGRALANEEKPTWEFALQQLRNSQSSSFLDMHEYVYPSIQLSFNFLGSEELKSCLFLCGLFPEDFDIPIESLLRHGVGLGLFKAIDAFCKARNLVNYLVNNLKRKFLLLDSNVPGCVKMHDIVSDFVISVASKNEKRGFMVKYDMKSLKEEKLNDINAISLISNETLKLENGLECPTLQLLQVRSKSKEPIFWPELFFQGMSGLKVLSVQNLCIPKPPSVAQASINLHTLQVEYCDVGDISVIGKELIHLEVLSFAHSNIKELPIEIGNLGSLRLLDLTECNDLNFISPNILTRLSRLEELYLRIENFPWKNNDVVINELKNISHQLKVVEMKVRGTEVLGKDLDFEYLEKFWVYVDPYTDFQRSAYLESNLLQVSAIDYKSIQSILMILKLIKKCEILALRKVKDLKSVISQLGDNHQLPYLKDLRVDSCPNLVHLIDRTVHCNAFPQIQSLSLKKLNNLSEMCYTSDHHEVKVSINEFSNLAKLELIDLPNLVGFGKTIDLNELHQGQRITLSGGLTTISMNTKLFSSDWMKQFPKLETILVQNCSSINMVFDIHGYSHLDGQVFPRLKEIKIVNLNKLTHVWSKAMHGVQGFQNLKFLTISQCNSIKHVFTLAIVKAITNLEKLEIASCKLLENLVTNNEDTKEGDHEHKEKLNVILFDKLDSLNLSRLPSIVGICANSDELKLPSLRKLKIDDCPKLDVSFLTTAYTEHDNLSVASSSNTNGTCFSNIEENYSRSYNQPIGCMPLCSKLILQSNLNKKINKAPSISERKIKVEVGRLPLLEELYVKNCDLYDKFFLQEGDETRIRHEAVIDGRLFPNLKSLTMQNCNKISVLFSPLSLRCFEHLEKLHLQDCKNLKEIVSQEEIEASANKIRFPSLQDLLLRRLPILKAFCQGSYDFDFSLLQEVKVDDCPNMEVFSQGSSHAPKLQNATTKIDSPSNHCAQKKDMDECEGDHRRIRRHPFMDESLFPNLTSLLVSSCGKINILFSYSSLCRLQHLEKLKVLTCKNIEAITSLEEIEASANKIVLPRLQYLHLLNLTKLKAFSLSSYDLYFPLLREVKIRRCRNIEVFSRGFYCTPKLEDVSIEIESLNCIQKKDLNATIQGLQAFVSLRSSEMLSWTDLCSKSIFGYFIKESTIMNVKSFNKLLVLVPLNEIQMLQHVRELTISSCALMVEVFESGTKKRDATTHCQLEELKLKYLPKLSHIWKHNITEVVSFEKLTSIDVTNCDSLKSLLSHSMARSLVQLKALEVERCKTMKEIVTKEDDNTEGGNKVKIIFPKLERLILRDLPKLECVCSGDCDYDIPLCNVGEDKEMNNNNNNNNNRVHISFPQLKELQIHRVPKLKCFYSGAYDYDIMVPSSIEECPNMATFPRGSIIVSTPKLHTIQTWVGFRPTTQTGAQWWRSLILPDIPAFEDPNLTVHYIHNSEKYKVELQKLETFRGIERDERLLGYIKRVVNLGIKYYRKLLNCVPSNMMDLFSHVLCLTVYNCERLKEIFESNDCERDSKIQYKLLVMKLSSLPKLKHIWKNHGHVLGFQYLQLIDISECHDLKYVFPDVFMATSLPNLTDLQVFDCNNMEEIIGNKSNPIYVQEQQQEAKIIFPSLDKIALKRLPSLKCFCRSSFPCYVEMPKCSGIDISDCPEMKTLWYNGTLYTPNLESAYGYVQNLRIGGDNEEVIEEILHSKRL